MNYGRRSGYQRHEAGLKRHEVDLGLGHGSTIGNVSGPEVHLAKPLAIAAGYFRAAHAYMLISMPTGTSTIFGDFQAILALLLIPDELRPRR